MSQKQPKLKVIIHDFGLFRGLNAAGCLLGTCEVIGKESCRLERICGCLNIQFDAILSFTRNEQIGCLKAFQDNANGAKHPCNVISHVGTPRNVSRQNMTRSGEVQKCRKNNQN